MRPQSSVAEVPSPGTRSGVGLAGAQAGWPCPLARSCLESRL